MLVKLGKQGTVLDWYEKNELNQRSTVTKFILEVASQVVDILFSYSKIHRVIVDDHLSSWKVLPKTQNNCTDTIIDISFLKFITCDVLFLIQS